MDIENIKREIEREYAVEKYNGLGWSFLYSPQSTLITADTVFLGLNPGGNADEGECFSSESGSAYTVESWAGHSPGEAPLQKQVRTLFNILSVKAGDVLSGNIIPFRSKDWASLEKKKQAKEFAYTLWGDILRTRRFRIVVMGKETENIVVKCLSAKRTISVKTGWGNTTARFYKYNSGDICSLPHLSRFQIFNRGKTSELEQLLANMGCPSP